jgi:CHAT domain-containing protein
MALGQAAAEAQMVINQYPGKLITPADFEQLQTALGTVGRSLVHLICHGKAEEGGGQAVYLESGDELTSTNILRMKGVAKTFAEKRPVVFLNACEVGRGSPALVGLGGFVSSFIRLGATAVIAPLWSVEDEAAHPIAEEFYRAVKDRPGTPFSRIFAEIRAKAYDPAIAKDTYAAYCFYGDPLASAR